MLDEAKLIAFRHQLHQYPEQSGQEKETARRIVRFLKDCSPSQIVTEMGGEGVLAVYQSERPGPTVLFRAELDALPIPEINTFSYRSQHEGLGHKCGHDGHATILLGLAEMLAQEPPNSGNVLLLFQPAEETGTGAAAVLADKKMSVWKPDWVFALHNIPGYPLGEILLKEGSFTPAVKSLIVRLDGRTAHAAQPETGVNPAQAMARIQLAVGNLSNPDPKAVNYRLATPVFVCLGKKDYGTSAGSGELHWTLRAWTNQHLNALGKELLAIVQQESKKAKLSLEWDWTQEFAANQNAKAAITMLEQLATTEQWNFQRLEVPFRWGEDFGMFTSTYRGMMFGLGAGTDTPDLHSPDYDFPDQLILKGIKIFHHLSKKILE